MKQQKKIIYTCCVKLSCINSLFYSSPSKRYYKTKEDAIKDAKSNYLDIDKIYIDTCEVSVLESEVIKL